MLHLQTHGCFFLFTTQSGLDIKLGSFLITFQNTYKCFQPNRIMDLRTPSAMPSLKMFSGCDTDLTHKYNGTIDKVQGSGL